MSTARISSYVGAFDSDSLREYANSTWDEIAEAPNAESADSYFPHVFVACKAGRFEPYRS